MKPLTYFIRFGETNYYKIGQTLNLLNRLKQFKTHLPFDPIVVAIAHTYLNDVVENNLKKYLKPFSTESGGQEWFELTDEKAKFVADYLKTVDILEKNPPRRALVKSISLSLRLYLSLTNTLKYLVNLKIRKMK